MGNPCGKPFNLNDIQLLWICKHTLLLLKFTVILENKKGDIFFGALIYAARRESATTIRSSSATIGSFAAARWSFHRYHHQRLICRRHQRFICRHHQKIASPPPPERFPPPPPERFPPPPIEDSAATTRRLIAATTRKISAATNSVNDSTSTTNIKMQLEGEKYHCFSPSNCIFKNNNLLKYKK